MTNNQISQRAKANFPTVLLTLLSIVQALALELMWAHLSEQTYLYSWSFIAVLSWLQIGTTLIGILLIWQIYSSLVMRFSWVPSTVDSVFPFLVGIVEFAQINALGPDSIGLWFIILGILFAGMAWISQVSMLRARRDGDNAEFFAQQSPATFTDHLFAFIPVVFLLGIGVLIWWRGDQGWLAFIAVVCAAGMLVYQFYMNHHFTQRSYQMRYTA
ncbi:MAG: hypothetical protein AAF993_04725 [Pseudomonadota bacterium]